MFQMKGQDKIPEKQVEKIRHLPGKEFIIMVVKMTQDLRKECRQRLRRFNK